MPSLRRLSLRQRLLLFLLPIVAGSAVSVGLVSHRLLERQVERRTRVHLGALLETRARPLEMALGQAARRLDSRASLLGAVGEDPDRTVEELARSGSGVLAAALIDQDDGRAEVTHWVGRGAPEPIYEPGQAPAWALPMADDSGAGRWRPGRLPHPDGRGRQVLWAAALVSPGDRMLVLFVGQDLVDGIFSDLTLDGEGFALVVSSGGEVLHSGHAFYPEGVRLATLSHPWAQEVEEGLLHSTDGVLFCQSEAGSLVLVASRSAASGIHAAFLVPQQVLNSELRTLWQALWGLTMITVILAALMILKQVSMFVRPIHRLNETMSLVAGGDLSLRVPVRGQDEMAQLSEAFNTMTADLQTTHAALQTHRLHLESALSDLENLDRVKDSFLSLVSHEVRTPLTSILGGVEFLRDQMGSSASEDQRMLMDIIHESGARLSGFMNDAILMASLQASGDAEDHEELSLTALLAAQIDSLGDEIEADSLRVDNYPEQEREWICWGDWTLLQVAVRKMLHNACRYNRGGGRIELRIVESALEEGPPAKVSLAERLPEGSWKWWALRVFNTGTVIPQAKLELLFEKFELLHDINHHHRGSGLSLPIVQYIAKQHGGDILARPVEDEGMAFYLILPMRQAEQKRPSLSGPIEGVDNVVEAAMTLQPVEEPPTVATPDVADGSMDTELVAGPEPRS